MKAAVVHEVGGVPRYEDFPDPVPGEGEVLIEVKAVAVENLDRDIVAGRHFSAGAFIESLPAIRASMAWAHCQMAHLSASAELNRPTARSHSASSSPRGMWRRCRKV